MEPMAKLLNRISDSRFSGLGIDQQVDPLACRTRAAFVDRMLSEGVAFQVENMAESDLGSPEPDPDLQDQIEEIRLARDLSPLAAYRLADQLRVFLVNRGYCDPDELPRYETRPWPR